MASVKWLNRIEATTQPYDGFQQVHTYVYKASSQDPGTPVTHVRVKSLMVPPGIPDWYTQTRLVDAGRVTLRGRAWSGNGVPIVAVDVGIDGAWSRAELAPAPGSYAWHAWQLDWQATAGDHELSCRATDAAGATQPLEPTFDRGGFGINAVHRLQVTVR